MPPFDLQVEELTLLDTARSRHNNMVFNISLSYRQRAVIWNIPWPEANGIGSHHLDKWLHRRVPVLRDVSCVIRLASIEENGAVAWDGTCSRALDDLPRSVPI